jgi:valyl-tRNA synthetase
LNYPPGHQISFHVGHDDPNSQHRLHQLQPHLAYLSKGTTDVKPTKEWPALKLLRLVTEGLSVGLMVSGDVDLNKAIDRLTKQLAETAKESQRLDGKLKNAEFVSKAPPEVIAEHHERVRTLSRDRALLASSEAQLRAMLGT